jgi:tetratricopeptide (TPR) repeat protein
VDHSLDHETLPDPAQAESPAAHGARLANGYAEVYWIWAICGLLLLAVGLVFGQTVGHEFVGFDDPGFVYENQNVTAGVTLPGLWWALTDGPFGEWCPLSTFSDMLDCELYGVEPGGHHLTNVLLHAASSVLLFLVLLRMTGNLWPSAWVAAVFAIHPLHVESVAWVAERRDVLSGLFFMLTLGAYTLYVERPSLARYLAVTGCFALGLMAKPMLVTVPFLLLLLDYWPLARFRPSTGASRPAASGWSFGRLPRAWRLVVEKIPLIALGGVSCGIVLLTHASVQLSNPVERLSLVTRLANALVSYATYLGESFYPARLAAFYPHLGTRLPMIWVVGSLVLLVAITVVVAYCWRRMPYLLVGWLWFLGVLVPVIGLLQIGAHARADRYTYLSQIGLSIALAWSVWSIYQSRQSRQPAQWRQWTLAAVSGAAVLLLAAVAWRQTSYWRNTDALWTRAVSATENNAVAHHNLGVLYFGQERTDEAIAQFREAVAVDFFDPQLIAMSHSLLADALMKQGKVDEALTHYEQAARIYPEGMIFHGKLATALGSAGRLDRAVAEWRETVRLEPTVWQARLSLADALLANGDNAAAAAECRAILDQKLNVTRAVVILGTALAAEGNVDEAISALRRALELDPQNAEAHFRLGLVLFGLGRSSSAIEHLDEAVRLQPDSAAMLWQTAWILATSPDSAVRNGARAVELATRAVQFSGRQEPHALDALAAALAETEQFPAAIATAERASALALARGDEALAGAIDQRTRQYRQDLPYRQPANPTSSQHAPSKSAPAAADE